MGWVHTPRAISGMRGGTYWRFRQRVSLRAIASLVIGLPALRLRGLYFGVATLAAQFIVDYLFKILEPITHGVSGLPIRQLRVLGIVIQNGPHVCDGMRSISIVGVVGDVPR